MSTNRLLMLFIIVLLLPLLSAATYQVDTEIDLKIPFVVNGHIPTGSAECNISLQYPNSTYLQKNTVMTNQGDGNFNVTVPSIQLNELGYYDWVAYCCDDVNCSSGYGDFLVTPSGQEATTSQGIIYFIGFFAAMVFFLLSLYGAIAIPWHHPRDDEGNIIGMSNLKYVKIGLWFLSYCLWVFILAIANAITSNFLFFNNLSTLFNALFQIFLYGFWIVPIVVLWIIVAQVFIDKKTYEELSRGWK